MTDAPKPFATSVDFTSGGFGAEDDRLTGLLARASRIMRAESLDAGVDLDQRIADGTLDKELAADVCCDMAAYALAGAAGGLGVESQQVGAGPYQETLKYANPVGQLSFTRVHKKRLGIITSSTKAWSVDMLGGSDAG